LRSTTDAIRTDILNGVGKLKRAFTRRQYLITREVWDMGERVNGNSIRKALLSYAWERNKEQPRKDGREDPLDALRYDCIMWRWADDQTVDQRRYQGRSKTKSRRVRVGGAKTRSF
jgi:hypothetical protein